MMPAARRGGVADTVWFAEAMMCRCVFHAHQACASAERMGWLQQLADTTSLRELIAERAHVKVA
jgi:hypothetical protein